MRSVTTSSRTARSTRAASGETWRRLNRCPAGTGGVPRPVGASVVHRPDRSAERREVLAVASREGHAAIVTDAGDEQQSGRRGAGGP